MRLAFHNRFLAPFLTALILINGCSNVAESVEPPVDLAIARSPAISVTPTSATITVGNSVQIVATLGKRLASAAPTVAWTSSSPGIASVSAAGVVMGVSAGNTTITAMASSYSATTSITVVASATPPTILSNTPANGATNVAINIAPTVTFSEPMQNATLTTASVTLVATGSGTPVSGSVSVSGNTATFTPSAPLANSMQYTATVNTAAKDLAGNALTANASWSFATAAASSSSPTLGAQAVAFKFDGSSTAAVSIAPISTQASGSTIIACVGRGVLAEQAPVSDNKGNTYTQIGTSHAYTNWGASGTACYVATNAIGGAGHVVTAPVGTTYPYDETTLSVVEVVNATRVQDFKWNEDLSSPLTSQSVTTTGPATLIALWWGDGNSATTHTATPDGGFGVIHSVLSTGNLVQAAAATKNVSAAGAYNVTWTSGEGAQLWLIAIQ